jgi:hypothetical protein
MRYPQVSTKQQTADRHEVGLIAIGVRPSNSNVEQDTFVESVGRGARDSGLLRASLYQILRDIEAASQQGAVT